MHPFELSGLTAVDCISIGSYPATKGNGPFWIKKVTINFYLQFASDIANLSIVPGKPKSEQRSGCPVSVSLEVFGDRWSLLVIRDLMVRGYLTFKDFQEAGEGISTNILADRLRRLQEAGIITAEAQETDARRVNYRLTEKGIDLAPVLFDLLVWGTRHEQTMAPCALIAEMENHREELLAEVRRRWRDRDSTPLIPRFDESGVGKKMVKKTTKERG